MHGLRAGSFSKDFRTFDLARLLGSYDNPVLLNKMSKRSREELAATNGATDADRAAKKLKKEKKRAKAAAADESTGEPESSAGALQPVTAQASSTERTDGKKLSKEERKALIKCARTTLGPAFPIIAGVSGHSTSQVLS